jgi:hypothetical protein
MKETQDTHRKTIGLPWLTAQVRGFAPIGLRPVPRLRCRTHSKSQPRPDSRPVRTRYRDRPYL